MRKLSLKEVDERKIAKIIKRIKTIESDYGIDLTKRSCFRYYKQVSEERKLKNEIKDKEEELKSLKKKKG